MRAAILLLEDFPGSDNRVQRQCKALLRHGHQVTVFCASGPSSSTVWNGARIERSPVRRYKSGGTVRRLYDYIAFPLSAYLWLRASVGSFDIVQVANPPDWIVLAVKGLCRSRGVGLVLDIHDPMPELFAARGGLGPLVYLLRALERASCREADVVLATTQPMAKRIRAESGAQVVHIPNAVDSENFPRRLPTCDAHDARPFRIVFHGTVQRRFGVDVAVAAVARLASKGRQVQLDVYGDGVGMSEVKRAAEECPPGVINLHGQVPASTLAGALAGAAVGLVPYRDSAFMRLVESSKALEYTSLGITVVGSDLPPLRSQLGDAGAVYVAPGDPDALAEAIASLMDAPEVAMAYALGAQAFTRGDDWGAYERRYVDALVAVSP